MSCTQVPQPVLFIGSDLYDEHVLIESECHNKQNYKEKKDELNKITRYLVDMTGEGETRFL